MPNNWESTWTLKSWLGNQLGRQWCQSVGQSGNNCKEALVQLDYTFYRNRFVLLLLLLLRTIIN